MSEAELWRLTGDRLDKLDRITADLRHTREAQRWLFGVVLAHALRQSDDPEKALADVLAYGKTFIKELHDLTSARLDDELIASETAVGIATFQRELDKLGQRTRGVLSEQRSPKTPE